MIEYRDAGQWASILIACGVRPSTAMRWGPAFSEQMQGNALSAGEAELDDFLGQMLHECTMFEALEENLNYRADRLTAVFPNGRISIQQAARYGRIDGRQEANQEAIANIVYGGQWGAFNLGNTQPGDGWKFRGRSPIHLTGRANYEKTGHAIGIDLLESPEIVKSPHIGLKAAIAWWEKNLPDSVMDNLPAVTKRVNGGDNGLELRRLTTAKARSALDERRLA